MPDKFWEAFLPQIPSWSLWPIAILAVLLFLWPKIREVWLDVVPAHRRFKRLRMALELEKLLYEIKELKTKNAGNEEDGVPLARLAADTESLAAKYVSEEIVGADKNSRGEPSRRSAYRAIIWGALGGALTGIIIILVFLVRFMFDPEIAGRNEIAQWHYVTAFLIGSGGIYGGIATSILLWFRVRITKGRALVYGFLGAIVLAVLLAGFGA